MKKELCAAAAAVLLALPGAARAEGDMAAGGPATWDALVTVGGSSLMTLLIVQFIKAPLDRVWKLPTALVAYLIALAILTAAHAMTAGLTLNTFLLCVLNAIFAATSAMGMYEKTFRRVERSE
ncbi:MAG: hypothetical protein ACI4PG_10605 [Candidatus Ventricola sp.]